MKVATRWRHLTAAVTGRVAAPMRAMARYAGGMNQRIVSRWFAELADANDEIRWTLTSMRARSREAAQNNGEAAGLLLDFEADIVGAVGPQLQYRAATPRGLPRDVLNDRVELGFKKWSKRGVCTLSGGDSFAGLSRLMIRTVITDGEFLGRRIRDPRLPFGYAIEPIDADLLDETLNRPATATQTAIIMGVEVDANLRPIFYHFWDRHPTQAGRQPVVLPASDVVHVFKRLRAGQVRGVPWFAPVLVTWKLGDRCTEAELYQALLAAAQGGFFVNKDNGQVWDPPKDDKGNPIPLVMEAEPGQGRMLPPGWEWQAWEPKHPTANFAGFMKVIKRMIGRAFGRSYASLTGDLEAVNFSSMRTDRVREMTQSRMHQADLLVEQFCDVVFRDWVQMASLVGALGVVTRVADDLASFASWMCTGWPWMDPVKDSTAAKMDLEMGITSPQRLCADRGRDYYDVIDEIADAKAYAELKKVNLAAVPLSISVQVSANDDPNEEEPVRSPMRLKVA